MDWKTWCRFADTFKVTTGDVSHVKQVVNELFSSLATTHSHSRSLATLSISINIRDEVHEAGQWLIRLVPHVTKLHHHLLLQLVINDGHGERRRLVGQEAAIVCALQVELQICMRDGRTETHKIKRAKTIKIQVFKHPAV